MSPLYDIGVTTIGGERKMLENYRGQVLLIVNVASKCGLTPQYSELEDLYRRHHGEGFTVLGFPCDQFAHQEPGDESQIRNFCSTNYQVSFPLFAKIEVNGPQAHPLFQFLTSLKKGFLGTRRIKWNFTKFLVDRDGNVVNRYAPVVRPLNIEQDLIPLLHVTPANSKSNS